MDIVKKVISDEVSNDMEKRRLESLKYEYFSLKTEYELCKSLLTENQLKEFEIQRTQVFI